MQGSSVNGKCFEHLTQSRHSHTCRSVMTCQLYPSDVLVTPNDHTRISDFLEILGERRVKSLGWVQTVWAQARLSHKCKAGLGYVVLPQNGKHQNQKVECKHTAEENSREPGI